MYPPDFSFPDDKCNRLIACLVRSESEPFWFRKLQRLSGMPPKLVRDHLKHLADLGIIEYVGNQRGRKLFRVSFNDKWKERFSYVWSRRVYALAQDALRSFGKDMEEELTAKLDLNKPTLPVRGAFLLEYRSDAQPYNLLVIQWDQVNRERVEVSTKTLPGRWLPRPVDFIKALDQPVKQAN